MKTERRLARLDGRLSSLKPLVRLLEPLTKPLVVFSAITASLIIAAILTCANIAISNLTQRASLQALYLATEFRSQMGPDYSRAKKMDLRLLEELIASSKGNGMSRTIAGLFPNSPSAQLQQIKATLAASDASDATSSNAIHSAAIALAEAGKEWANARSSKHFAAGPPSSEVSALVDQRFAEFSQAADAECQGGSSIQTAEMADAESSLATLALISSGVNFSAGHSGTKVQAFIARQKTLADELRVVASKGQCTDDNGRLIRYADNLDRRFALLSALSRGENETAKDLLLEHLTGL